MANYPSLHPASFIFPTDLYLRDWPAASAHQLTFSCGELFGRLHLRWEWDLQVTSLMSFILGLLLLENAELHQAIWVFSLLCALLLAQVANCMKSLHSSAVTRVKSIFLSNRQSLDSCKSWPLCSQWAHSALSVLCTESAEWLWKLLIQSCKRDFLTPCPLTQAKLFTPSSSLAVSEEMRGVMLALGRLQQQLSVMALGTPGLHWNRGETSVGDWVLLSTHRWANGSIGKWCTEACVEHALWQPAIVVLKKAQRGFNAKKNEQRSQTNKPPEFKAHLS